MDIATTLSSTATGGLLGGLFSLGGAAVQFVNDRAAAKELLAKTQLDYKQQADMKAMDHQRGQQEAMEGFAKSDMENHFASMQKVIEDQMQLGAKVTGAVLDALALFRPGLTVLLIILAFVFGMMKLHEYFDHTMELVGMAVAWWFGDRQRNKTGGVA